MTTSGFVDELKARLTEAQRRLQSAQQDMQLATAKYQGVAQEVNSLSFLINQENAKLPQQNSPPANTPIVNMSVPQTGNTQNPEQNKTDMIRGLLKRHPGGMTPTEIWKEMQGQLSYRAYLYSVLKRLRDRDEVIVKRGKYIAKLVPKPAEGNEQSVVQ